MDSITPYIEICYNLLFNQTVVNISIVGAIFYLIKFYAGAICSYPRGPIPLPVIGNVFSFPKKNSDWDLKLKKLKEKYGPVFTLWLGQDPFVFICDLDIAKEAFSNEVISGRPISDLGKIFNNENQSIIFGDPGQTLDCVRNVALISVKKFAKTENLADLAHELVERNINLIKLTDTSNAFSIKPYVHNIIANILGSSLFSQKFNIEDEESIDYKYLTTDFLLDIGTNISAWQFVPIINLFINKKDQLKKYKNNYLKLREFVKTIHENHEKPENIYKNRDFCDTLVNARRDVVSEVKDAEYLTNDHLSSATVDLFLAGVITTQISFEWILLFMAFYPEHQKAMREEVQKKIGNRKPSYDDRAKCHYVQAFISEVLRYRNATPFGLYHKGLENVMLRSFTMIPKETSVIVHQKIIMMDEKHLHSPEQFNPRRFLNSNNNYASIKPAAYIPFGLGRRVCPGEQLAMVSLCLVLVNFLQMTKGYNITLENEYASATDLEANTESIFFHIPKDYKIVFEDNNNKK